jgi:putative oxidoreductase
VTLEPQWQPLYILQILCGIWFIPHAIGKALNIERASQTFDKVGFRPGRLFVVLTIAMEALAAIGLVFDIHARLAATLAVGVLLGAAYAVLRLNGLNWRWQKQGPEYMLFWALACILAVLR